MNTITLSTHRKVAWEITPKGLKIIYGKLLDTHINKHLDLTQEERQEAAELINAEIPSVNVQEN